jgi:hypothetical protein
MHAEKPDISEVCVKSQFSVCGLCLKKLLDVTDDDANILVIPQHQTGGTCRY